MGFQLWYSKQTGIRRKGTSFSELQDIFIENITTKYIFEPLACCKITDNTYEVKKTLIQRDFDTLGVVDNNGQKLGYVVREKLGTNSIEHYIEQFEIEIVISESTPLSELFEILLDKEYVYVLSRNSVDGIVTRADINKPIVRIYLFGLISLFELHLNFWITKNFKGETWQDILNPVRIKLAENIYKERKGNNVQLTLLECIQICDKRDILRSADKFREDFDFSKSRFERLLKNTEKIRNELAHSQNSIIANLEWTEFVSTLKSAKEFLVKSEEKIEKKSITHSRVGKGESH
ncbi:CBS domain-containing protein [Pararhodonellum marinum]|uniref:CBS domain-containing protein n=1 Tax=Pararhodonellum marinum TaxID=2755358 RepID=UPI00188FF721|nr:CBS domain-containing protein [Pararhodonellum marinum]